MHEGEDVGATIQLERARAALGEALGGIQDVPHSQLNVEKISESLALSVRNIFNAQNVGILEPLALAHLNSAMDYLRTTLELMQEAAPENSSVQSATETVARTLALLYPVVCSLEKIEEFKELEKSQQMTPYQPPAAPSVPAQAPAPVPRPSPGPQSIQGPGTDAAPFDPRATQTRIQSVPIEVDPAPRPSQNAPEPYTPPRIDTESTAGQYHKSRTEADPDQGVAIGAMKLSRKPVPASRPSQLPSTPPPGVDERRRKPRRTIDADIGMQSGTNFFTGFSLDISSGGLYISTYDTLPMGASVNVNFDLPGGPVLSLNGVVQWVREYNPSIPDMEPGIGVRFVDLTEDDERVINRYIAENPPIFYEED